MNFLKKGKNFQGVLKKTDKEIVYKEDSNGKSLCGGHASVVIGSRFNKATKQCEFLIRNTYGEKCKYHEDFECESGQIWVDHTSLSKNIFQVNYLSNQGE